jgi:hypothetical protein
MLTIDALVLGFFFESSNHFQRIALTRSDVVVIKTKISARNIGKLIIKYEKERNDGKE